MVTRLDGKGQPSHQLHSYTESADGRQFLMLKDLKAGELMRARIVSSNTGSRS
jgi:hypothetical protein